MSKIIFILGGARSGKSSHAVRIAKDSGKRVAFIATCEPGDDDLKKRVARHKRERPRSWKTFEEAENVAGVVSRIGKKFDVILIDCLTLFTSNHFLKGMGEKAIKGEMSRLVSAIRKSNGKVILISNEVGLGIHPETKLGRDFRDIAGRVNQMVAKEADEVIFMVSGIPWRIK